MCEPTYVQVTRGHNLEVDKGSWYYQSAGGSEEGKQGRWEGVVVAGAPPRGAGGSSTLHEVYKHSANLSGQIDTVAPPPCHLRGQSPLGLPHGSNTNGLACICKNSSGWPILQLLQCLMWGSALMLCNAVFLAIMRVCLTVSGPANYPRKLESSSAGGPACSGKDTSRKGWGAV